MLETTQVVGQQTPLTISEKMRSLNEVVDNIEKSLGLVGTDKDSATPSQDKLTDLINFIEMETNRLNKILKNIQLLG